MPYKHVSAPLCFLPSLFQHQFPLGCPTSLLLHPRSKIGTLPGMQRPLEAWQGSLVHPRAHWRPPENILVKKPASKQLYPGAASEARCDKAPLLLASFLSVLTPSPGMFNLNRLRRPSFLETLLLRQHQRDQALPEAPGQKHYTSGIHLTYKRNPIIVITSPPMVLRYK